MILVDLSQTIISVAFQNFKGDYSKDMIRAMVFQTLVSYKKKYGAKYGNLVLAIDSPGIPNWRKEKYSWYKARRKNKLQDPVEKARWEKIFECANSIVAECKEFLTWKTVGMSGAEADDVIAILSKYYGESEPILIMSTDGDFPQLQKYSMVSQYAPAQKKMIKVDNPIEYIHLKILQGDKGDDIPNILSENNSFIDGIRQKSVTEQVIKEWLTEPKGMKAKYKQRYEENKELIDFDSIPLDIEQGVLSAYDSAPVNGIQGLFKFFMSQKMTRILEDIELFKVKPGTYADKRKIYTDDDFFDGGNF